MLDRLKNLMSNKTIYIILVVVAIFIGIAIYVYKTYVAPKLNPEYVPNREFIEEGTKEAEVLYFYTEWCPYCKKAAPIWEEIVDKFNGKIINNTTVFFKKIDCDKDEEIADQYKVEGYPTIKLIKENEVIEYNAKPNVETLTQFLHTTL